MSPNTSHPRHIVTAVIVAHDGARLLPGLIRAMRDQTFPVSRAIGVDTGSRDRSGALLTELLGADAVFGMDPGTGYGAAVARALQHPAARRVAEPHDGAGGPGQNSTEWIWLLHDDCQPAPDALEHLLRAAGRYQTAAVLGPKLRDLADRRVLREVGLTVDRAGRRLSGIEPGEIDQGQHDGTRNVLAVSSAGMLIRRDVWDRLGGFDPQLPLFRDDIDFCWRVHAAGHDVRVVTDAVLYHRELSARHSRKQGIAAGGHPRLLDRRSTLYVFAVNLPFIPMLTVLAGCVTGSVARAAYFLLTKQQRRAAGHLGAIAWLFGHPGRVWRGRRDRAAGRARAYAVLRPHLPHGRTLSRIAESLVGVLSRSSPYEGRGEHGGAATDDPDDDLPLPPPDSVLRRVLTHPGVLLFLALVLVTAVSERALIGSLLRGSGTLAGGALVPAWGGASDLWREYLAGYHPAGVGSAASAPPYLGVVAAVATVFGGKPWLAVDVLLLGCVPVGGITAYLATRRVTEALAARIWIAASYALLPVASGAVAAGRLGSAVAFMLLPLIGISLGRMFTRPPRAARRAAWASGLLIAIAAAFVPLLWVMAAAGALGVTGLAGYSRWRSGAGGVRGVHWMTAVNAWIAAVVPAVLLVPWTFQLFAAPADFLLEAGIQRPGLAVAGLRPEPLLLLSPGGPGLPPVWVSLGLIVPAFWSLLLGRRRGLVGTGWAVALGGLVSALVVTRLRIASPLTGAAEPAWPGVAFAVTAAGLLLAATPVLEWAAGTAWGLAVSSASLATRARLAGRRGAVALLLGVVAMSAPVWAAGYWLTAGVRGPLSAAGTPVLPPFISASSAAEGQPRTLVLRRDDGELTYQVLRNSDPLLGEPELAEAAGAAHALSATVASLDSADSQNAAAALSEFAIGYVLLPAPVDPSLAAQLDGVAGLQPLTASAAYDVWRVEGTVTRVRVLTDTGSAVSVPSGTIGTDSVLTSTAPGTLVLAEPAGGWSASLNGHPLKPLKQPVDGWAQGFALPAGGGRLVISRDDLARDLALGGEAAALLIALVLALPGTRTGSAESSAVESSTVPAGASSAVPAVVPGVASSAVPAGASAEPALSGSGPRAILSGREPDEMVPVGAASLSSRAAATGPQPVQYFTPEGPLEPLEPLEPFEPVAESFEPAAEPFAPPAAPHGYATGPVSASGAPFAPAEPPASGSAPLGPPLPLPAAADDADPRAPRKRGGSHRAARHGKPSRGWRGKPSRDQAPEPQGPDVPDFQQPSDDLSPAMPDLFSPAEEATSTLPRLPDSEPVDAPWARADPPPETPQSSSRPPWELGDPL